MTQPGGRGKRKRTKTKIVILKMYFRAMCVKRCKFFFDNIKRYQCGISGIYRNLINTNHYEKPFRPEVGSNLRAMLFELISPQMNHAISKEIDLMINNYEPRCRLVEVNSQPAIDKNAYEVTISFYVVNHPEPVTVESFLERIR